MRNKFNRRWQLVLTISLFISGLTIFLVILGGCDDPVKWNLASPQFQNAFANECKELITRFERDENKNYWKIKELTNSPSIKSLSPQTVGVKRLGRKLACDVRVRS